jgi:hypothetical protein
MIPEKVIVTAIGNFRSGLAICLKFSMSKKNDYYYIVFLNEEGKAEINTGDLLRSFDADRNFFLMDYVDPRAAFTGQIEAHVLSKEEIAKSIDARNIFKKFPYPENYFENLNTALVIAPDEGKVTISVEKIG